MYSLPEKDRLRILSQASLGTSKNVIVDMEIEKMIASTLPPVSGMVGGLSDEEKAKVFAAAVHQQREDFIAKFGDAF